MIGHVKLGRMKQQNNDGVEPSRVRSILGGVAAKSLMVLLGWVALFMQPSILAGEIPVGRLGDRSEPHSVRVATFNVSLYGERSGEVLKRLRQGSDPQSISLAAIIRDVRPDILLLNEIDFDADGEVATRFVQDYLNAPRDRWSEAELRKVLGDAPLADPIDYPHRYVAASNTGEDSGRDLNADGKLGDPEDAFGFGRYPGQYSMAVLSKYPIDADAVRTFRQFPWARLPEASIPLREDGQPFYDEPTWRSLRLSSKNHLDVPVVIGTEILHVLASHPTPPVFDGPEDRNGHRNHDEIAFWTAYLDGSPELIDDSGARGGLIDDDPFVVVGDLNSDPERGDSRREAIAALIGHRRIQDPSPRHGGNDTTAPFGGGMRVDYVLPSKETGVIDSGVFWPSDDDPRHRWIEASDHRMVWVDLRFASDDSDAVTATPEVRP